MVIEASGSYLQQLVEFPTYPLQDVLPYETLPSQGPGILAKLLDHRQGEGSKFWERYQGLKDYLGKAQEAARRLAGTSPRIPALGQEIIGQAEEIRHRFDRAMQTFTGGYFEQFSFEVACAIALVEFQRGIALEILRIDLAQGISLPESANNRFSNRVRREMEGVTFVGGPRE